MLNSVKTSQLPKQNKILYTTNVTYAIYACYVHNACLIHYKYVYVLYALHACSGWLDALGTGGCVFTVKPGVTICTRLRVVR